MKRILLATIIIALAGCSTQPPQPAVIPYVPAVVTNSQPQPAAISPDPVSALPEEIRIAYRQPHPPVVRDGITTIYPYNPHTQPMINCMMLRVTEIVLEQGETVKPDDVSIGDSERWAIKVTPNRVLVNTDLVVVTSLRSYHFALRTHALYQPQVSFYYPEEIRTDEARYAKQVRTQIAQAEAKPWSKLLNFDYSIKGPDVVYLSQKLYERTEGNPLLMANVVEDWTASGILKEMAGRWNFEGGIADAGSTVPDNLRQMLERQIERLDSHEQQVLEAAGIAGVEFSVAAVAAALETDAGEIEQRCETMTRHQQFLRRATPHVGSGGAPAGSYRFLHALYRQVCERPAAIDTRGTAAPAGRQASGGGVRQA